MTAFEGWAFDRDYLNDASDELNRVGAGETAAGVEFGGLKATNVIDPVRFRILDDDGEPYYGGSISRSWLDGEEERAFAPLKFGAWDAGATELQYRDGEQWKTL